MPIRSTPFTSDSKSLHSSSSGGDSTTRRPNKPWLDPNRPLLTRVEQFVEAPRLHPADLASPLIADLVEQCCRLQSIEGMQAAQEIVDRLLVEKRRWKAQDVLVYVPASTLQLILYGWAVLCSSNDIALLRMKEVLVLVIEEAKEDTPSETRDDNEAPSSLPTVQLFNTYLQGLANAAKLSPNVALETATMLDDMVEYHATLRWHTKPNSRSFTHTITAFANSRRPDAGDNAIHILRRMQREHAAEKESYLEEYGVPYNTLEPSSNVKRIVTADAVAYTATISALVRSEASTEKSEKLLNEMLQAERGSLELDAAVFVMVIKAYGNVAGDASMTKDKRKASAKRAEAIFWSMMDYMSVDDKAGGAERVGTSFDAVPAFNACLDAWSRSGVQEAAPRTEMLLQKVLESGDVQLNTISFNSCLSAWSKSGNFYPYAADRAELLLLLQHELCACGRLGEIAKPDFQSYTITILARAYSDHPEKVLHARHLLEEMISSVKRGEVAVTRNTSAPFSAVLTAAARSRQGDDQSHKDAFEDAFNSVVDTKTDAYSIALQTYNEVKHDIHKVEAAPDHHVFGVFLRCIARHCPPSSIEREQMSNLVFEDACLAGQVSRLVVESLAQLDMMHLLEIESLSSVADLPKVWWRNVPPEWRELSQRRYRN